jgi:DNA polymerase III gamma/tau subunit
MKAILKEVVRSIAEREGYTLADGSLELIATLGDGSFRDTQAYFRKS